MPFNGKHVWNHGKPVWNKGKAMKPPAKFRCKNCGKQQDNMRDGREKGRFRYLEKLKQRVKELESEVYSLKARLLK